ncbi:hypothetical protein EJ03DRAFT_33379 [Teratosphaeria nubilosa]|uniref:O-methyltransferase dimerisation domain-containing protein n=1 Tax=Teratosphaeria nubilosa TaxID=161662 RepID=A0A6G1KVE6_9PEZI|nr:hypothetical protein EJ03DRAFT_33379 [Teratosphaeria nubilosa]
MAYALYQQTSPSGNEALAVENLINMRVIEALPTIGSISLSDLSNITSTHPDVLHRLLQLAIVAGFLHQTRTGEYAHTASSIQHTSGCSALMEILGEQNDEPRVRTLKRKRRVISQA